MHFLLCTKLYEQMIKMLYIELGELKIQVK